MTNANLGLDAADIAYLEMAEGGKINRPGSPLDGYTVDKRFGPSGSGAAAYGLSNANGDVVIAFRGTQDLTDVVDDVGNLSNEHDNAPGRISALLFHQTGDAARHLVGRPCWSH